MIPALVMIAERPFPHSRHLQLPQK